MKFNRRGEVLVTVTLYRSDDWPENGSQSEGWCLAEIVQLLQEIADAVPEDAKDSARFTVFPSGQSNVSMRVTYDRPETQEERTVRLFAERGKVFGV